MKRWRPGTRLTWTILGAALTLALVTGLVLIHNDVRDLQRNQRTLAEGLVRQVARAGHLALLADNRPELNEITRSVLQTDQVLGTAEIRGAGDSVAARAERGAQQPPTRIRWMAAFGRALASLPMGGDDRQLQFRAQIPPAGEGSLLDPFGTPRADIGEARITLSDPERQRQIAQIVYRGIAVTVVLFLVLTASGYGVAWFAGRPLSRLGQRLRDLSGEAAPTGGDYADIEDHLTAIGERLSQSEHQVREYSEALRGRERELALARDHARNAARMRADLVAGMSHELRAPLTAILGHTNLLERSGLKPEQRDYVATVRKSARNLLGIIDDVLAWSGLESGRASLNEVGFNLVDTVEDTLNLLAPLAFEKDLELVHFIYRDVPVHLRGDPLRIQQILTNLVSNAIKFTDSGGITVRLMLENESDDQCTLRVSVADTGRGIAAEDMPRLFDMYERLQSGDGGETGSGLGLAITKRLLEMMGGEISVDSTPGRGSEFEFVVPLRKAANREQRWVPWTDLQGKRAWLYDGYGTARLAQAHQLDFWGMPIEECQDLSDLARRLGDPEPGATPDILVLGLRQRDLGQNAALRRLFQACHETGLPVLVLINSIDRDILSDLERMGANRVLPKSSNRLHLYRSLCELTGVLPSSGPGDTRPLDRVPVLVADNSPATRHYLTTLLNELGAGTAQAANGTEAVAAWRKGNFPLGLIDAEMPEMDGEATIRKIRELATSDRQPLLVAITADADPGRRDRLLAAGADACLVKPFDEQGLWRVLQPHMPALGEPPSAGDGDGDGGARAAHLAADPELSSLLADELPRQTDAVRAALADADHERARAEIHTLHGTAAFYGLERLRQTAADLEKRLQAGERPTSADLAALDAALTEALAGLR